MSFSAGEATSAVPAIASFSEDCLPPEGDYSSREALVTAINTWSATRGYAFITRKSTTKSSGRKVVTYACDRSWKSRDITEMERKRRTTTRGTSCPFSVLAKESLDKTTWSVAHRPDTECAKHNHPPSHHPSAHPVHRQLGSSGKATISELVSAGIAPKDIQTYLRQQDNSSLATRQDIYNCIAKLKDDMHEGQSSIHALINRLDREGFWSRVRVDENQRVTAILFAHPGSLQYVQAYSDLLLLDCTYKTNKYQMPLLDMIGVDACQRSFCIAFAFLSGEQEADYIWALERLRCLYESCGAKLPSVVLSDRCIACINAVEIVFPSAHSLLCLWHANRAVLAHCLPVFKLQERHVAGMVSNTLEKAGSSPTGWAEFYNCWHSIMQSPTESIFNSRVANLEAKYLLDHADEVAYIKKTWLQPYKEKLVKAWVDQHMHFGNAVTSRVEGIHALLKSYLKSSKFDLFDVWRIIKHAVENQLAELQATQARQQTRKQMGHAGRDLFDSVHGWVSHEAIKKVEEQRKLLIPRGPTTPLSSICTGTFTKSHGLPCAHKLKAMQDQNRCLELDDFHQQWYLKRNEPRPRPILEPNRVESRITASSRIARGSTQREPSAFEQLERTAPTCSRCHAVGHKRSSKACPLRQQEARLESTQPALDEPIAQPVLLAGWSQAAEDALLAQLAEETESQAAEDAVTEQIDREMECQMLVQAAIEVHEPEPSCGEPPPSASAVTSEAMPLTDLAELRNPQGVQNESLPRYAPEVIYERYVAAKQAWFKCQPRGSLKTTQAYRKALGLPLRYSREEYAWCQDFKQMGQNCSLPGGLKRKWTTDEMMAYLDWDAREDERAETRAKWHMENDPDEARRCGMGIIWKQVDQDLQAEEALSIET